MKNIAVTGCTGGMGQVLCDRLAKAGYNLALCSNMGDQLAEQAEKLKAAYGINIVTGTFNIYDEADVEAFFNTAEEELGKLDALVNLAGLSIPTKMETVTPEDFDLMMDVNVKGTLFATKHYALHAVDQDGLVICIGSMAAKRANGNAPLYCTAKCAVNMLSSAMQLQLSAKDIRLTTLNPGGADTPFWGNRAVDRSKLLSADDVVDVMMFVIDHPRIVFYEVNFESETRVPGLK